MERTLDKPKWKVLILVGSSSIAQKSLRSFWFTVLFASLLTATWPLHAAPKEAIRLFVASPHQLEAAMERATLNGGHTTIVLAKGQYLLRTTLVIEVPHISLISQSGNPADVAIVGDIMGKSARIGNLIRVAASDFRLQGITLARSGNHLIQIAGERNADRAVLRDCILRDSFEQLLKISRDAAASEHTADDGLIENCVFEYSAGIGPQYYIGGIDAHGAKRWAVRKNLFRSIASPSKAVAEFAIHFWAGSADNLVERNAIVDCDRGIGFGLDNRPNERGIIRNNIIYHSPNGHPFGDVGIALIESPETTVHNNTVVFEHAYPWAIEYRFRSTKNARIFNNLSNRPIAGRDSAHALLSNNLTDASISMFFLDSAGIPRLKTEVPRALSTGKPVTAFEDDYFGQARAPGLPIDIGAEQFSVSR